MRTKFSFKKNVSDLIDQLFAFEQAAVYKLLYMALNNRDNLF